MAFEIILSGLEYLLFNRYLILCYHHEFDNITYKTSCIFIIVSFVYSHSKHLLFCKSTYKMNIVLRIHLIGALCFFSLIFAKDLKYFSNFKPSAGLIVGRESAVTDFVTLTNSPGSDLPNEFTICNSLFIEFMTSLANIVSVMKKDGTHWFSISYETTRSIKANRSATLEDLYYCVQTGKFLSRNCYFFIYY